MTTQLAVCQIILTLKEIIKDCNRFKQTALDADPTAIQEIKFTANLERVGNATMFFIIEEPEETVLDFSQGTVKVL